MMGAEDKKAGAVVKALGEMDSLLEFGGDISPFLEELFSFLGELVPLMNKFNRARTSTSSTSSAASDNIRTADVMAESATNRIMNNVEQLTEGLDKLVELHTDTESVEILNVLQDTAADINLALQFQDITSQHLHYATELVKAIQTRLDSMYASLQEVARNSEMVAEIIGDIDDDLGVEAGDGDPADTIRSQAGVNQADIDALFKGGGSASAPKGKGD